MSPFFPLLFITALGPQPAWLPPAISPYHCSGSQPWAPQRQSPLGPSWQGVEGRWGVHGGSWCQAELVWLVSSPPGTSEGLGGAEWAKATGPGRRAASSQPLPSPHPTGGDTASPGSWAVYHRPHFRKRSPQGQQDRDRVSRDCNHLWEPGFWLLSPRPLSLSHSANLLEHPQYEPHPGLVQCPSPSTCPGGKHSGLLKVVRGSPGSTQSLSGPQDSGPKVE